jgi:hypothetical protein
MLSLVSAANASNTKVDGRCDFLIFSKKCECESNTKNESVWDMCVAGASTAGKKIVDANAIVFPSATKFIGASLIRTYYYWWILLN